MDQHGRATRASREEGRSDDPTALINEDLLELRELVRGADSIELKLTLPEHSTVRRRPPSASTRSTRRSARCSSSTPLTSPSTGPASSPGPGASRAASTTRWSSCGRSSPPSCPTTLRRLPEFVVEVDALPGRLRVLRVAQGHAAADRRAASRSPVTRPAAQAVLEGAAGVLRRARSGRHRRSTTCPCSARSSCSSSSSRRRRSAGASSPRCGSTRTAHASSSCRPSACPGKASTSPGAARLPGLEGHRHSTASSRPRPRRRWSSSRPSCAGTLPRRPGPTRRSPATARCAAGGSAPRSRVRASVPSFGRG